METPERPDRSLPSPWTSSAPVPAPYAPPASWDELPDPDGPPSGRALTPRLVLRAMRRYWWLILLLWIAGSVGLVVLVQKQVKPTFESTTWLKVEPSKTPLGSSYDGGVGGEFMDTQVQLITSPDVLNSVVQDPEIAGLPSLRTLDPETTLRNELQVAIPPKTNLILISMSSTASGESAKIVNAVAQAYLESSTNWLDTSTREQIIQLREYKQRFKDERQRYREELERLSDKGAYADPRDETKEALNAYVMFRSRANQIELEILDAEATISTLTALKRQSGDSTVPVTGPEMLTEEQLEMAVQRAFLNDPEIHALRSEMTTAKNKLQATRRTTSRGQDPAAVRFENDLRQLRQQYEQLWQQMRPILQEQMAQALMEDIDPIQKSLNDALIRVDKLREELGQVEAELDELRKVQIEEGNAGLDARFASEDLQYANEMYNKMALALEALEMQVDGPAKVTLIARGESSAEPTSDNRAMMMAGAPVGLGGLLVVLFVLLELRGARVADPEELSSRLRLGVIGVVPPLPSLTAAPKGPKALRDQRRRLEEFVQSLDHLRVTLCASAGTAGHRRCVLITSAVGGEGKTTLAAQLAGRCANAGLTTLLVDADLRRPSLGELLEVPEGPGLAEVLLGESTPEEAMVVIGNAGGFHLLPAGGGGHDPSRLLQGERLGQLVARLREAFDIVLIDAPPVLPVPDALLIGRWTDGAVVAVRHDSSRFPLVERAQKRLTSIGVPLIGAVVNGVRPAESGYGAYDYYATIAGHEAGV